MDLNELYLIFWLKHPKWLEEYVSLRPDKFSRIRVRFVGIKKSCSEKNNLFVVVFGLFCLRTLSVEHSRQPGFYEAQPEYH
jgi:hypothetical protein